VDTRTRIEELISRGESEVVEFKAEIPQERDRLLKTIAGFANGQGGTLLLGVSDDEPSILVGVRQPTGRERDRLVNMIRDVVTPEPAFAIEEAEIEGKVILAIHVAAGSQRPYGLHPDKPAFYVRRGASTFNARQDEIRALSHFDATKHRRMM
jgi:predicted HTH transcriptional regulator